jgi:hypothetical protein
MKGLVSTNFNDWLKNFNVIDDKFTQSLVLGRYERFPVSRCPEGIVIRLLGELARVKREQVRKVRTLRISKY